MAVETRVVRFDDTLVRNAILRELNRDGQIFFVHNRIEDMHSICGLTDPPAILDWCFAQGARNVVLKLGREGCIAATQAARTSIAGHLVKAVDATGAGDCFDGALLARLHAGDDLAAAARYANAAAALTTTGFGAVAPLPLRGQVLAFLATGAH